MRGKGDFRVGVGLIGLIEMYLSTYMLEAPRGQVLGLGIGLQVRLVGPLLRMQLAEVAGGWEGKAAWWLWYGCCCLEFDLVGNKGLEGLCGEGG